MIRMIFSTVRAPHEPALTVESFAISATGRPPMAAVPVITPSAGSPAAAALDAFPELGEVCCDLVFRFPAHAFRLALLGGHPGGGAAAGSGSPAPQGPAASRVPPA